MSDNRSAYAGNIIPRYSKLEITFSVQNTVASNLQWPYDPAPPPGITPGAGITVNALFTPDNWATTYAQPAFLYQPFYYQVRNGQDWLYPVGPAVWMVRFAPTTIGIWQYRLIAHDASGSTQSPVQSFSVGASTSHGFVRVSPTDSRYFEFSDGTYFPGLGYNMNWDQVDWKNPVLQNRVNFQIMGQNGIQLVRLWLSQWAIFGANWNPWRCIFPSCNADWPEVSGARSFADHDVSMAMYDKYNPCMSSGHWLSARIAVKPNTTYRIRVRVKTENIAGPRISGQPFGFVAKITDNGNSWLLGPGNNCSDPGVGTTVTNYLSSSDWTEAVGTYRSGADTYFLSSLYLTLTNVRAGQAYVDRIVMEEELGRGNYGPNILAKPGANHHQYADQNLSARFDKVVELAEQNGVYLRPVVLEKQDDILGSIDYSGNVTSTHADGYFYGNGRTMTKVRWLQQMWWRYLQARWGYSTAIHSWELLNEGDPNDGRHAILADEFAKYMHQFGPDTHLVTTSTWAGYPASFWLACPHCDFTDYHRYIFSDQELAHVYDPALATFDDSQAIMQIKRVNGIDKPVVRGETGFVDQGDTNHPTRLFDADIAGTESKQGQGLWLHNFVWGQINPGGLIESYWYASDHIYGDQDLRPQFRGYYLFIQDIPLSNGHYVDAAATTTGGLRAWGQKDLVNQKAHLWIQNPAHQWNNATPPAMSGDIIIPGFRPNSHFRVEWWNTYSGAIASIGRVAADETGRIVLHVSNLKADTAVKISAFSSPTARPSAPIG